MQSYFLVFSGNWEVRIKADDFVEAALQGTKTMYTFMGEDFQIGFAISVIHENDNEVEIFCPIAIFEDLGMYKLASELKTFFDSQHD